MRTPISSGAGELTRMRVQVRHLPRELKLQHELHQVRAWLPVPDSLRARTRLRPQDTLLQLARHAARVLQP